ncbi:hypothetical protein P9112_004936 [Eukaryota sp. TZLM1-RC]
MTDYLRSFLKVKEKADCLAILNSVFIKQFVAGITPKGLAEFLVSRINVRLIPDFKTLVQVATERIVAHDRSKVSQNTELEKLELELEKVNTILCVVNEVDTNTCSKSRLGDVLNVYDSDYPDEEPYEVVLNPLTKNLPSSEKRGEKGVVLDVE